MRKFVLVMMAFFLVMFVVTPSAIDAKPRGGFKSGTKSFNSTTPKSKVNQSNSGTSKSTGTTNNTTGKKGFFGGGSFLGGMMMGGLAGMMFGSMLGSGFMGNMLGLLINVAAIFILFAVIRSLYTYFVNRRKVANDDRNRY
ncbi:hypothetical protein BVG16_23470 [Paenibacillus selenitireducens]|uniref:Preprotein translocase subunit Tim44 n=1 Tax=Paenibacillus selenitireducens TaxID=1324314 RepID=A0A1T2X4V2_9BACL|nr:hypothetical protein [Paenibacillus selenitireducens]OPA74716.1 hypothetical protein BVG16_23470 [Paenibacillus selenitireducens]